MRKIIYLLIVIIGAVILNSSDTMGFSDMNLNIKEKLGFDRDYEMEEVDEDTFQNRVNSVSAKVGTKIDFSDYQCSSDNTSYFVNDICLSNDDLKEIITKVIVNVTPERLQDAIEELRSY